MPRNLGERERVVPNLIATQTTVWQKCVSRTVGMGRRNESLGEMLLKSPWWVSAALGVFAFAGLRWGLHAWFGDNKSAQPFVTAAQLRSFCRAALRHVRRPVVLVRQTKIDFDGRTVSWMDSSESMHDDCRRPSSLSATNPAGLMPGGVVGRWQMGIYLDAEFGPRLTIGSSVRDL